jgi:hypothetical protein
MRQVRRIRMQECSELIVMFESGTNPVHEIDRALRLWCALVLYA